MTDVVAGCLLLLGSFVGLLAAVGLVRMPDFFGRLQASTKAQTLGLVTILLGAGLALNDLWVWLPFLGPDDRSCRLLAGRATLGQDHPRRP